MKRKKTTKKDGDIRVLIEKEHKFELTLEMVADKTFLHVAEILGVKLRQLLDVAKQRSNNSLQLNGRTCMSSELWILLSEYLQNTYNIKQRNDANLIPSKRVKFKPTAKYKSKFKASLGKPGNYWKLIYIRAKG